MKTGIFQNRLSFTATTLLALSALSVGCAPYQYGSTHGSRTNYTPAGTDGYIGDSTLVEDAVTQDPTGSGGTGSTGGSTWTGTDPLISFSVRSVGYTATTYTVRARKSLKVRFTPGVQDSAVKDTGFHPQYSKLAVYVKVGERSQPTALLSNGMTSGSAENSHIMDFSSSFEKTCAEEDATCREEVTITVEKPNYDFYCLNYGMYCSHTQVYETHPWNGTLTVQTDDTVLLKN